MLAVCLLSTSYNNEIVCCLVGTVVRCALSTSDWSEMFVGEISMIANLYSW